MHIVGIGTAVPIFKQSQMQAAEIVSRALNLSDRDKRLLKSVYKSTGISYRHSVMSDFCKRPGEYSFFPNDMRLPFPSTAERMQLYQEEALPLALEAIDDCLINASRSHIDDVTHLITVSCTGMYAPGLDIQIIEKLFLSAEVKRFCLNFMGCYGVFNALKLADTICRADSSAKVLIVSVELCTIHFQKNDSMDNIFSNAIFADGAGAVLVQNRPENSCGFFMEGFYCDLLTNNRNDMTWKIADNGFDIVLSSYVPQAIEQGIPTFFNRMLTKFNYQLEQIDLYAIHPGGYKILKACEQALKLSPNTNRYAYEVLNQYGNMSSATILFVLKRVWQDAMDYVNQRIFSCAFGPGLTLEAMFLRVGTHGNA